MRLLMAGRREDRFRHTTDTALRMHGFDVRRARYDDIETITRFRPRAVLLDLGLIDDEALVVCDRIRNETDAAIVVVTSRVDPATWLQGRNIGIDDYVVRPFGIDELSARIRAAVRVVGRRTPRRVSLGPIVIDPSERTVAVFGTGVALTRKEFDILQLLASEPGTVQRREQICRQVWDNAEATAANRSLEVHIASLRAKLGLPDAIKTVRGIGYVAPRYEPVAA